MRIPTPPAQADATAPEQIIVRFRKHGRHLALPVVALLLAAGLGGFYIGKFDTLWQNLLVALGVVVLFGAGFVVPLVKWLAERTTITTKRVIMLSGLATRVRTELPIMRVRSVATRRSMLQRLHGSGDIKLAVTGEDTEVLLSDVPGVIDIAEALQALVQTSIQEAARATGFYTQAPQHSAAPAFPHPTPGAEAAESNSRFTARRRL